MFSGIPSKEKISTYIAQFMEMLTSVADTNVII